MLPELMMLAKTATPKMAPPIIKKGVPFRFGCPIGVGGMPGAVGTGGGCAADCGWVCDAGCEALYLLKVV